MEESLPEAWADVHVEEVTPVVGGGAYATTLRSGLWFLAEGKAVRVEFDAPAGENDLRLFALEIIPTAEGGAYAASPLRGIWYLRRDRAILVEEVPELRSDVPIVAADDAFFALYAEERRQRRRAEGEALDDHPDYESDREPYY